VTPGALSNLSLVIITLDEEDNIARCIDSVPGAGEVVVVDSFSVDRTVALAVERGARIFQRPFAAAADQKNWAMEKAEKEWILILDADEACTPELVREIEDEMRRPRADGYLIRRRSEFMGRRINFCGWHDERLLRLFKRGRGRYPEREVHEKLLLEGSAAKLMGAIEHRPYRDLPDYIDRMKSYSCRGAVELRKKGRHWFPAIVTRPIARFVRMYCIQLGVLDGAPGFILCVLAATSVFFKYAALREISKAGAEPKAGGRG